MGVRKRLNLQILLTLQGREGREAQIDRFTFYPVVKRLLWQIKKKQNNRDYLPVRWIVLKTNVSIHLIRPARHPVNGTRSLRFTLNEWKK